MKFILHLPLKKSYPLNQQHRTLRWLAILSMKFILHLPLKKKLPLKPVASHPIFLTSIIPHISPLCQSPIPFAVDLWYNGHVVNSQNSLFHTEGGEFPLSELEILVSFIVSVAAGIATHYICKWLDRHKWRQQPKMKAPGVAAPGAFPMPVER